MQKIKLTDSDRNFLSVIRETAVTNPFSQKRICLDKDITSASSKTSPEKLTNKLIATVRKKVDDLKKKGLTNINFVDLKDREFVETLILFDFFYGYRKDLDNFIFKQIEADEKNMRLGFAHKAKEELERWGFSNSEIQKCFEEASQLRRAFFFIKRNITGKSPVMKELRASLWDNIFTHDINLYRKYLINKMEDFSTLILGETGTGKGAIAAAIGRSGYIPFDMKKMKFQESFTSSFFSINLSQFPDSLIESELFGHKKGSFTGAIENYQGIFKRCSPHGSIFLDEIGDISPTVQVKLLQVIQDRIFYPVGSYKKEKFYGRVIAATNLPINKLREKGQFRDDFYYRLCSDIIQVPTLYERIQSDPNELPDLISFLIQRMLGSDYPELANMVHDKIDESLGKEYPWPGNVRELEQCIRRILIKKDYKGDIKSSKVSSDEKKFFHAVKKGKISAQNLLNGYCRLLYDKHKTFEEVAKITKLDRRTVNKYIKESDDFFH